MTQDVDSIAAQVFAEDPEKDSAPEPASNGPDLLSDEAEQQDAEQAQPDTEMVPRGVAAQGFITTGGLLTLLDERLGDGIPFGSLTLVEGSSHGGKSILCQHLAYGALTGGGQRRVYCLRA